MQNIEKLKADFIKKITPDFTHTYSDSHYQCQLNDYYYVREGGAFKILLGFHEGLEDIQIIVIDKETERTSTYKLSLEELQETKLIKLITGAIEQYLNGLRNHLLSELLP